MRKTVVQATTGFPWEVRFEQILRRGLDDIVGSFHHDPRHREVVPDDRQEPGDRRRRRVEPTTGPVGPELDSRQ